MSLTLQITDAGRAALVDAENTGTLPLKITEIALGTGLYTPSPEQESLVNEIADKRLTTFGGVTVAADTIHVTIRDTSTDSYSLGEFGLYTDSGVLFAVYSQSQPIVEKAADAVMVLAVDTKFTTLDVESIEFGPADFLLPPATKDVQGVIRLALEDAALTGENDTDAMTPKTTKAVVDEHRHEDNAHQWEQIEGRPGAGDGLTMTAGNYSVDDTVLRTTGSQFLNGDLTIGGNLFVQGEAVQVDSQISTADRVIILNEGEPGAGVTGGFSGVIVDRGSLTNYEFGFNEVTGFFELGKEGSRQAVATRENTPTDQAVMHWDASLKRLTGYTKAQSRAHLNVLEHGAANAQVRNNQELDARYVQQDGYNAFNPSGTYSSLRAQGTTAADVGAPPTSRTISAGSHLSGGGSLAANRTLNFVPEVQTWIEDAQGNERIYLGNSSNSSNGMLLRLSSSGSFQFRNSGNTAVASISSGGLLTANTVRGSDPKLKTVKRRKYLSLPEMAALESIIFEWRYGPQKGLEDVGIISTQVKAIAPWCVDKVDAIYDEQLDDYNQVIGRTLVMPSHEVVSYDKLATLLGVSLAHHMNNRWYRRLYRWLRRFF